MAMSQCRPGAAVLTSEAGRQSEAQDAHDGDVRGVLLDLDGLSGGVSPDAVLDSVADLPRWFADL